MADRRAYFYRCTSVTTVDYGDSPSAGQSATAEMAAIPDGSDWTSRPPILKVSVPVGTRPGGLWRITIEEVQDHG